MSEQAKYFGHFNKAGIEFIGIDQPYEKRCFKVPVTDGTIDNLYVRLSDGAVFSDSNMTSRVKIKQYEKDKKSLYEVKNDMEKKFVVCERDVDEGINFAQTVLELVINYSPIVEKIKKDSAGAFRGPVRLAKKGEKNRYGQTVNDITDIVDDHIVSYLIKVPYLWDKQFAFACPNGKFYGIHEFVDNFMINPDKEMFFSDDGFKTADQKLDKDESDPRKVPEIMNLLKDKKGFKDIWVGHKLEYKDFSDFFYSTYNENYLVLADVYLDGHAVDGVCICLDGTLKDWDYHPVKNIDETGKIIVCKEDEAPINLKSDDEKCLLSKLATTKENLNTLKDKFNELQKSVGELKFGKPEFIFINGNEVAKVEISFNNGKAETVILDGSQGKNYDKKFIYVKNDGSMFSHESLAEDKKISVIKLSRLSSSSNTNRYTYSFGHGQRVDGKLSESLNIIQSAEKELRYFLCTDCESVEKLRSNLKEFLKLRTEYTKNSKFVYDNFFIDFDCIRGFGNEIFVSAASLLDGYTIDKVVFCQDGILKNWKNKPIKAIDNMGRAIICEQDEKPIDLANDTEEELLSKLNTTKQYLDLFKTKFYEMKKLSGCVKFGKPEFIKENTVAKVEVLFDDKQISDPKDKKFIYIEKGGNTFVSEFLSESEGLSTINTSQRKLLSDGISLVNMKKYKVEWLSKLLCTKDEVLESLRHDLKDFLEIKNEDLEKPKENLEEPKESKKDLIVRECKMVDPEIAINLDVNKTEKIKVKRRIAKIEIGKDGEKESIWFDVDSKYITDENGVLIEDGQTPNEKKYVKLDDNYPDIKTVSVKEREKELEKIDFDHNNDLINSAVLGYAVKDKILNKNQLDALIQKELDEAKNKMTVGNFYKKLVEQAEAYIKKAVENKELKSNYTKEDIENYFKSKFEMLKPVKIAGGIPAGVGVAGLFTLGATTLLGLVTLNPILFISGLVASGLLSAGGTTLLITDLVFANRNKNKVLNVDGVNPIKIISKFNDKQKLKNNPGELNK